MNVVSVRSIVEAVLDPEIPALTLGDLGVIRDVREGKNGFEIDVTPTYSGCPATRVIHEMISEALIKAQVNHFDIKKVLS
ncbi:MAG: iron-sulfur cluster assembly protein, partial [Proteobacteria bacterium]|nr:iron-sulfur cluster assembly protein [Pseudomonadota bacterium]